MGPREASHSFRHLDQVDRLCDAFEQTWQAGRTPPRLEDFLAGEAVPLEMRPLLFEELLRLEIHYLLNSGETIAAPSYRKRFPEMRVQVDLVLADMGLLGTTDDPPVPGSDSKAKLEANAAHSPQDSHPSMADESTAVSGRSTDRSEPHLEDTQHGPTCGPAHVKLPSIPDYEFLEEIGRGGMGVVFKARQLSLGRIVAVKMILSGSLAGPEEIRRFRGEAQAAAALRHANMVAIHDVREYAGQHYFTMDLVDGCSLKELIRQRPLPPDKAAAYVRQISEAIHYAHNQGILHRDLKPANVLIDGKGTPLVTDFGLAKRMFDDQSLTASDQFVGTLCYAPPEQATGQRDKIGPAADIYSLGAILYELLTGRPPFKAATFADTLNQVVREDPAPPRLLNAKVPRDLETICLKCLSKKPSDRYRTASELAEDLGCFSRGEPVRARRIGPLSKAWRWCRRKPGIAALCLTLLIAVGAVSLAIVLASRANRAQQVQQLSGQFQTGLDQIQFSEAYLGEMEGLLGQLRELDAGQAASYRARLYNDFESAIRRSIYQERLEPQQAESLSQAIAALESRSGDQAVASQKLQQELSARLSRPESIFALSAPFDDFASVFGEDSKVVVQSSSLTIDTSHLPATAPTMSVESLHNCQGNVAFAAEFASSWQTAPLLGLLLGHSAQGPANRGYEFVVRQRTARGIVPVARQDIDSDAPPPENPADYWVEIYRDGALLQQQVVRKDALGAGPLALRVSRRNYQLAFQVNSLPPLEFQETFPLTETGVFGIRWPRNVAITSLEAKRMGAPPQPSALQQGDELFNRADYREALRFYEQQARISPEQAIRQEADYKRAMCHRRLQQDDLAEEVLQQLMTETGGHRWPFMAACEAWTILLEQGRMEEAEQVYEMIDARFSFEQLASNVPSATRNRIFDIYNNQLRPSEVFRPNPNRVRDTLRLEQIERLFQTGYDTLNQKFRLMTAYRYEGQFAETLPLAAEIVDIAEATSNGVLPFYVMIYCRMLRRNNQAEQALELLDTRFRDVADQGWRLLERARVHYALGNYQACEDDLRANLLQDSVVDPRATVGAGTYLMLGMLLKRQGRDTEAIELWRSVYPRLRSLNYEGASDLLYMQVMGSLVDDWNIDDTRMFFSKVVPGDRSGLIGMVQDRMLESAAFPTAMRTMWRMPLAAPYVESIAFDELPMPDRARVPFRLLGVSYLQHGAFGGEVSVEQEQLCWELTGGALQMLITEGYESAHLQAALGPFVSCWLIGLPSSPLVVGGMPEALRGGLAYVLGHRFLRRGNREAAVRFWEYAAEMSASTAEPSASPISRDNGAAKPRAMTAQQAIPTEDPALQRAMLARLVATDLRLLDENAGLLLLPTGEAMQGHTLVVRQNGKLLARVALGEQAEYKLNAGSYQLELLDPSDARIHVEQSSLSAASRHAVYAGR